MKILKFKLAIDLTDKKQVDAFNNLLVAIGDAGEKTKRKLGRPKKNPVLPEGNSDNLSGTQTEISIEKPNQKEQPEKTQGDKEPTVTLADLRALLAEKVAYNRDECANKLKEMNTKNVSSLASEHYDEFYAFLESLENES